MAHTYRPRRVSRRTSWRSRSCMTHTSGMVLCRRSGQTTGCVLFPLSCCAVQCSDVPPLACFCGARDEGRLTAPSLCVDNRYIPPARIPDSLRPMGRAPETFLLPPAARTSHSAPAQDRSDPSVLHNPSVRVAVLIAMPSQYPDRALSSSLSASPSEASISEKGKAGANGGAAIAGHGDGESAETELPHVVFGIAELPIIASQQLSSSQSALRDAPMGRDMNGDQV